MTQAEQDETNSAFSPEATAEMALYGIKRIPVDYFHVGEFRYTSLKDAVAQAKRQKCPD